MLDYISCSLAHLINGQLRVGHCNKLAFSNVKYACPFSPVASRESNQEKRKRKRGDSGGRVDSEEDAEKKKKKKESLRPNYFVSIPITNTQVKSFHACVLKHHARVLLQFINIYLSKVL